MAFWDFLPKLFRGRKPGPTLPPAPADRVETLAGGEFRPPADAGGSPESGRTPGVGRGVEPARAAASPPPPDQPLPGGPKPGDFLPINRDELLKQGEEARRTGGWMWFGRRDIIPPTSDPRTLLIDRGMLTQGFLSADELAEMHRVGDEWDKHANRVRHIDVEAGQSAEQAVEADRAARAEVKARKKAEAAERKRLRAEGVAHRKATDIIFVGKGVSARMNDRTSDAGKLAAAGVAGAAGFTSGRKSFVKKSQNAM